MRIKSALLTFTSLLFGAVGGFVAGYYFSKNKYLAIADKEIESVKQAYENHFAKKEKVNESTPVAADYKITPASEPEEKKPNGKKEEYVEYAKMYGDTNGDKEQILPKSSIEPSPKPVKSKPKKSNIHLITPEEYSSSNFEAQTLIYYSDKVLADSDGNVIHDIIGVVGPEALSSFGRYSDDTVYVRDEAKQIDYEIVWDSRSYVRAYAED